MGAPSFIVPKEVIAGIEYLLTTFTDANKFGVYTSQMALNRMKAVEKWLYDVKNESMLSSDERIGSNVHIILCGEERDIVRCTKPDGHTGRHEGSVTVENGWWQQISWCPKGHHWNPTTNECIKDE